VAEKCLYFPVIAIMYDVSIKLIGEYFQQRGVIQLAGCGERHLNFKEYK